MGQDERYATSLTLHTLIHLIIVFNELSYYNRSDSNRLIQSVRPFRTKRHGMLIFSILLYDNVGLHTAAPTQAIMEHFNWKLFDHPPYSPDITPSYYDLLTCLKNWL
jgi:transposase